MRSPAFKLSRLALVDAVKTGARCQQAGVALQLAINMSADTLLHLPVADLVSMHRPERSGLVFILELPERQVASKIGFLRTRFPSLQQCGISIAIDNFGCGSFSRQQR